MRGLWVVLLFLCGAAIAAEFDKRELFVGSPLRVRLLSADRWIAINHTPNLISLKIDEAADSIEVFALKKSGEALVEIAPLIGESRFLSFEILEKPRVDTFRYELKNLAPKTKPILSEPPSGRAVFENRAIAYFGEPKGIFHAVYADRFGNLLKKQIASTSQGLVAFDSFLEIYAGEGRFLEFEAAFALQPILAVSPEKGDAAISPNGIFYKADAGAKGIDKLLFLPFVGADPITLAIRVKPLESHFFAGADAVKLPFSRVVGGSRQSVSADENGLYLEMISSDRRAFRLKMAAGGKIRAEQNGGFWAEYEDAAIRIDKNSSLSAIVGESRFSLDGAIRAEIFAGGLIEAANAIGTVIADSRGIEISSGALSYAFLPRGSEAQIGDRGFRARAVLAGGEWFLPFGWIYGEDEDGAAKRLFDAREASIEADFGGEITMIFEGSKFFASPMKPRAKRALFGAGWSPFCAAGSVSASDMGGVVKMIETADYNDSARWAQFDARVSKQLNRLRRLRSGGLYQIFAQGDLEIEAKVFAHSPVWLKSAKYVCVQDDEDAPMTLPENCAISIGNAQTNSYRSGEFYTLECR
ncbi:hypothetical protein FACS189487_00600 [Campylobacterota bacterium]|nr:hypothetical protein FACS189487_00600 [Campylobacterota bacterium]